MGMKVKEEVITYATHLQPVPWGRLKLKSQWSQTNKQNSVAEKQTYYYQVHLPSK